MRNSSLARQSLLKRTPETLDEGDLFASAILALVAILNRVPNVEEGRVHSNGFMAILQHVSTNTRIQSGSGLAIFRPVARNLILLFANDRTYSDFFRFYSCCKAIIGKASVQHESPHLNGQYSQHALYFIEDILVKALEKRLHAFDGGIEDHWMAQAVQDASEDLEEVTTPTLDESSTKPRQVIGPFLRRQFCRTLLALLNSSSIAHGFLDSVVTEMALSLLDPISLLVQRWHTAKDTFYSPDIPYIKRALCLCLLAIPRNCVMRSLSIADGERSYFRLLANIFSVPLPE
jgi:hypothetical protein